MAVEITKSHRDEDQEVYNRYKEKVRSAWKQRLRANKELVDAVKEAAENLSKMQYERLVDELREECGDENLEVALLVAKGSLDVLLMDRLPTKILVKLGQRKGGKATQERLLKEKFGILQEDGSVIDKTLFEMYDWEKLLVVDEEGYIRQPKQQKVGGPKKPNKDVYAEAIEVVYNAHDTKVIFKSGGRFHQESTWDSIVYDLCKQGVLDQAKEDFLTAIDQLKNRLAGEDEVA